jgi:malonyl-CoA O-methyltransferase
MPSPLLLAPRSAYALWADVYPDTAHNPLMSTEQYVVAPLIASVRPTRALDLGTGSGRYLPVLASAGASTVVGLDFSAPMLARGRARGVQRVCGDARCMPFEAGRFDLVNASLMAGDIHDLAPWLSEVGRVLSPGGHVVYSDFHPSWSAHGWRRTFETADGHKVDLPYEPHTIADHLAALEQANFNLLACYELPLADGDPSVEAFRRRWGNLPVLVVVFARKA